MMITPDDIHVLYSEEDLQKRIKELAEELNKHYNGEEVFAVCVLKGSVMFFTDLVKHLTMPLKMEFIRLSSYGSNYSSSGKVKVVEDIIDTGHTAKFLLDFIGHNFKTKTTKFCSLLNKKAKRVVDVDADFSGFIVDDKFLVGYGLDFEGYYRNIPYIGYVDV